MAQLLCGSLFPSIKQDTDELWTEGAHLILPFNAQPQIPDADLAVSQVVPEAEPEGPTAKAFSIVTVITYLGR